ncbi:Glutaryl-7-aminocephalosporanic-acid acylase [Parvibaculum lavamentivorans DS-1]|uniref:Glutaryl-7-aminocephalosporanic-acid acylase n=1 Tax=Parvibaculum lavamentivorans (strain DS-1 / DSM 13023 / NCIMB 13966) TaxID=402881 RepID=A7HRM7_PARL1|nr:acylase [Parvibaculum lavamentivorans]ABS62560.1 Glutaryl-7-aminocephalosporanic-acid acylase [Parvibaculum lavamentivorans DS-1]
MPRIIKTGFLGLAGLVLTVLTVVLVRGAIEAPAPADPAPMLARAANYDATIKRDTWGVPHIFGKRDVDVAFGFGFAHSEDDFATIQEVAIATRGELASVKGERAAITDYLVNLMGVWETVDARYESDLSPEVRRVIEAYADGVNYYAALHPEEAASGFLPLNGKDVAAGFIFKTPFFYGLDKVLMAVFEGRVGKSGGLSKEGVDAFLPTDEPHPIGSNGVAVSPARSADGATRLLVNSHQPFTGPVAWYEAVLESDEGWHVAGGFFPGSPFMLHGHNAHLGWANTVNEPDLVDVYQLTLKPDDEDQYLLDGEWWDFEKRMARIRVKLWGPFWWTVEREVLRSEHGPVLKTPNGAYAVRYAGIGEIRQVEQYYALDKATQLSEWMEAMKLQALPSINYLYADRQGNIAYIYNAQFPDRKEGVDWSEILPGDDSSLIWRDYLPFDDVPMIVNPNSGYVFNANNTPFRATAANDNLRQEDFSEALGIQSDMTNRAKRLEETYGADTSISGEEFRRYKYDVSYSEDSRMAEIIDEVLAADPGDDVDLKEAQAILRAWDRVANVESRGAALAVLTAEPVVTAGISGQTPPAPMDTLRTAMNRLKTHFGRLDPEWGEVNRFRRGAVDLPVDGAPDVLRAIYGTREEDGTLTAHGGDTFIMFVEWDKAGRLTSESTHQFGSATLDISSPHYADQAPLFVGKRTKPVFFTAEELGPHIAEEYRPGKRAAAAN